MDTQSPGIHLQEPRMEEKKTILIAGLMKEYSATTAADIPLLWQQLRPHFGKIPGQVHGKTYGVIYNRTSAAGFVYLAGVEVSTASDIPEDLSVIRIPDLTCAVFAYVGHVSALAATMSAIWNEWLPASGLSISKTDEEMPNMLEEYGDAFDPSTNTGEISLWVPVKNRSRMVTFDSPSHA